jgi:hypothetical protein
MKMGIPQQSGEPVPDNCSNDPDGMKSSPHRMMLHIPSIVGFTIFWGICYAMSVLSLTRMQLILSISALVIVYCASGSNLTLGTRFHARGGADVGVSLVPKPAVSSRSK